MQLHSKDNVGVGSAKPSNRLEHIIVNLAEGMLSSIPRLSIFGFDNLDVSPRWITTVHGP